MVNKTPQPEIGRMVNFGTVRNSHTTGHSRKSPHAELKVNTESCDSYIPERYTRKVFSRDMVRPHSRALSQK